MEEREQRICEAVSALWRATFDAAPPQHADSETLLEMMFRRPPAAYSRFSSPHLSPRAVTMPTDKFH